MGRFEGREDWLATLDEQFQREFAREEAAERCADQIRDDLPAGKETNA